MAPEYKFEILFEINNKDFSKSIAAHYTTLDRLTSGADDFDYDAVTVIAKRLFTGKTDEKGNELYDGDIVKNTNPESDAFGDVSEILYNKETCGFEVIFEGIGQPKMLFLYGCLEKIGNIYESPGLVKTK
ncbi:MAG: hypothetical protein GW898_10620 [Thiomicrospira sp.]|nr:hypothetical protein [Thiomicrospira sp.]NCO14810.1 hypothetical protein [Thiomicrospira sp.]NCO82406.1 hypothetical protein [Thiomicrospira sp.]OIP95465.1 MAG: hypothetical protein AUK56_05340 [Thiomicrospira sp. CG2_30_44_34]